MFTGASHREAEQLLTDSIKDSLYDISQSISLNNPGEMHFRVFQTEEVTQAGLGTYLVTDTNYKKILILTARPRYIKIFKGLAYKIAVLTTEMGFGISGYGGIGTYMTTLLPYLSEFSEIVSLGWDDQGQSMKGKELSLGEYLYSANKTKGQNQFLSTLRLWGAKKEKVKVKNEILQVQGKKYNLKNYQNIYVVGAGKATYKMALALEKLLGKRIKKGFINIPDIPKPNKLKIIKAHKSTHPLPSPAGVKGAKEILKILKKTKENDLVVTLISGGGSALLPLPAQGVSLVDLIKTSSILIKSSLTINEINTVRKHLSGIKGGRLVDTAYPSKIVNLIISDVCGDDLSCIASGLTVPDHSTFRQAVEILKKNDLWLRVPKSVRKRLQKGVKGLVEETPKPFYPVFREKKVDNFILANHETVLDAACSKAKELDDKKLMKMVGTMDKLLLSLADLLKQASKYGLLTIFIAKGLPLIIEWLETTHRVIIHINNIDSIIRLANIAYGYILIPTIICTILYVIIKIYLLVKSNSEVGNDESYGDYTG